MMLSMSAIRWLAGPLAALAVGVAACGGGDGGSSGGTAQRPSPTPTTEAAAGSDSDPEPAAKPKPKKKVDPGKERIVKAWANTLRRGRVRAAARYFALPSLVSNGTPPIKLKTRAQTRIFNRTLPCGAKVIATERGPKDF